jgi:hypothetical protein
MSGALRGDIEFEIAVLRTYELYSNYVAHLRGYLVLFIRGDSPRGGPTPDIGSNFGILEGSFKDPEIASFSERLTTGPQQ